jgi:hypothetical protein
MYLRARPLVALLAIIFTVKAIPTPLGHSTPKYTSSRIIYREPPATVQIDENNPDLIPRYKTPELPYHSDLNFGDTDEDGPEILSDLPMPSKTIPKSMLPHHSNLDFGDTDDDGPIILSESPVPSPAAKKVVRGLSCDDTPRSSREGGAPLPRVGPQVVQLEQQNQDCMNPLKPESGAVVNLKRPFSFGHDELTGEGLEGKQNGELYSMELNAK